jgi:transcriptional antiterminator RfaH
MLAPTDWGESTMILADVYWAVARVQVQRERVAQRFLGLAGYETYLPVLAEKRRVRNRKVTARTPLFPAYLFVLIKEGHWWAAEYCVGVVSLIRSGEGPAAVPDAVITEIRSRERGGVITLARRTLARGSPVRVIAGALAGSLGLFDGMRGPERVAVLLGSIRATVPADAIELAR